jgi:PrpF protein
VMSLSASMHKDGESWRVEKVSVVRTARRLMEGYIYVPERFLGGSEEVADRSPARATARVAPTI